MSDTTRTDRLLTDILDAYGYVHQGNCPQRWVNHARELERELNAATSEIERLRKANLQLREGAEEQQQRMNYLRKGVFEQNQEIEQTFGKVLGYPWFKDDQKNFPGATEKDGVCVGDHVAATIVSELASRYTEALARIKRLEEAGDAMAEWLEDMRNLGADACLSHAWREAKEDKP